MDRLSPERSTLSKLVEAEKQVELLTNELNRYHQERKELDEQQKLEIEELIRLNEQNEQQIERVTEQITELLTTPSSQ